MVSEKVTTKIDTFNRAKEKASALARSVNSFGVKAEEMATEWYENERDEMLKIVIPWIYFASIMPDHMTDGRNEASVERFKQVAEVLEAHDGTVFDEFRERIPDGTALVRACGLPYEAQTARCILNEHRTLQQSLAGVALRFLRKFEGFPEEEMAKRADRSDWYRFPMV